MVPWLSALAGWDGERHVWAIEEQRTLQLPAGDSQAPPWHGAALPLEIAAAPRGVLLAFQPPNSGLRPGILSTVADQLAIALEKARLFELGQQRTAELEIIAAISTALRTAQTAAEMAPVILDHALRLLDGHRGTLYLLSPAGDQLELQAIVPPAPELLGTAIPATLGIVGHVVQTGQIHSSTDLAGDPLLRTDLLGPAFVADVRSAVSVPLRQQALTIGVISIGLPQRRRLSTYETNLLGTIAEIAGSALERARFLETLENRVAERTQELAAANEQLQELDRLKTKFVADVTHELRTPITSLALYVDLIKRGSAEKRERYLDTMGQQVTRLGNLIEDIMSLNRLELSKQAPRRAPLDLNDVVERTLKPFHTQLSEAGLRLQTSLQPDLPPVLGEPNQLAQVLTNLLSNAVKYAPGSDITVETRLAQQEAEVQLVVCDQGPGIPQHEQARLFGRFYRGEHSGQTNVPGTGLGLAIVKEIVDLHQGRIELQSDARSGTCFTVTLPTAPA